MQKLKNVLKHHYVPRVLGGFGVVVVIAALAQPQIAAATAGRANFVGCVPTLDRQLAVRPHQAVTFRVVAETDDKLLVESAKLQRNLKAHKAEFVTVTLPPEAGWYEFKLASCHMGGYIAVLQDDGKLPPMGLVHGPGHQSVTEEQNQNPPQHDEHAH